SEVNRSKSSRLAAQLRGLGATLGILRQEPAQFLRGSDEDTAGIELLISVRATAKKEKNYAEADRVRKALLDKGVVLEDGPGGTTWRRQ
ncbi:MAG: CysS/YqeB C-terminal domain-containing protein, partial [Burkholderiaceae bacterium]